MIGIIGNGVVGGTLAGWLEKKGFSALVYDRILDKSNAPLSEVVERSNIVFICIWLEDNAAHDVGIQKLWRILKELQDGTVVVIRTTVVPGTCDFLQKAFKNLTILFCPEFLTEAHSQEDFEHPAIQIVGGDDYDLSGTILELLPEAPNSFVTTRLAAEWSKFAISGFLATKVSWFCQLQAAVGAEFDKVREMVIADPRIGGSHADPMRDGYLGWGGKCFTKDVPCLAEFGQMGLVQQAVEYNNALLALSERRENLPV